jgi:ubiquinol-cytochrome c reductase iron-sulfur subunit
MRSTDEARAELVETFQEGAEGSGFARRTMISGSLLGAMGLIGLPAIVLLRDLGPNPGPALSRTLWNDAIDGVPLRIVTDVTFAPIRPADLEVGTIVNGMPENFNGSERYEGLPHEGPERQNARAHSPVIMVRMSPDEIRAQQGDNWDYEGILCFSKICTHIGCPINLYEHRTHHLLCPCHQSTFDLSDAAKVIFGPAARHLPQLPIGVDDEGYLIARQPFAEPVGPSFWERG